MPVIDVHTHFSIETSSVAEDAERIGFAVENKSAREHLDAMDRLGITRAILSCPTQKYMDDEEACSAYCREVNETGSELMHEFRDRFSFAASLPLPFVKSAVNELVYAVDELGAVGVGLCSNYRGMYLGNEALEPLWNEIKKENFRLFCILPHLRRIRRNRSQGKFFPCLSLSPIRHELCWIFFLPLSSIVIRESE